MGSTPIDTLESARRLRNDQEVAQFEQALAEASEHPDPALLPRLLRLFDDATDDYGLFWSLVHVIEDYESVTEVEALVRVLPSTIESAYEWMELLILRVVNDDQSRPILIDVAKSASDQERASLIRVVSGLTVSEGTEAADALATRAHEILVELRRPS